MRDWQTVYQDPVGHRAEIVRTVLEDMGLAPVIVSKKDSAYNFGHVEVLVAPDHVLNAIKIINEEIRFE